MSSSNEWPSSSSDGSGGGGGGGQGGAGEGLGGGGGNAPAGAPISPTRSPNPVRYSNGAVRGAGAATSELAIKVGLTGAEE